MERSNFACNPLHEIESPHTKLIKDKDACKMHCERSPECRYYYFNVDNSCKLYTACSHISPEQKKGTTYEKQTKGLSMSEINMVFPKVVCLKLYYLPL